MVHEKRKAPPKRLKKNERRQDMKIITSASQADIYVWAISIAAMVAVLVSLLSIATVFRG